MNFCAVVMWEGLFMFDRKFKKYVWCFLEGNVCICQRPCICQHFEGHFKCNTKNDTSNVIRRMTLQMLYVYISIYIHALLSMCMSK